jgi:hypothetical protein
MCSDANVNILWQYGIVSLKRVCEDSIHATQGKLQDQRFKYCYTISWWSCAADILFCWMGLQWNHGTQATWVLERTDWFSMFCLADNWIKLLNAATECNSEILVLKCAKSIKAEMGKRHSNLLDLTHSFSDIKLAPNQLFPSRWILWTRSLSFKAFYTCLYSKRSRGSGWITLVSPGLILL